MSILNRPTLVVNKTWYPIYVETVKDSVGRCYGEGALIIDAISDSMERYDWDTWVDLSYLDGLGGYQGIRATRDNVIRAPEVIQLIDYNKIPNRKVKLNKWNLMIRDGFSCQYTGRRLRPFEADMDHVIPKSRGGSTSWTNLVLSDKGINREKGNRTPTEAGLTLRKKPVRPVWHPLYTRHLSRIPESWMKFLGDSEAVLSLRERSENL